MAGVSMGTGLTSGIDYSTMIAQLMQIESQPQAQLKTQLKGTQTDAATYRDINTSFAALSTAAQALANAQTWTTARATGSSSDVSATATTGALNGSLSFAVNKLAGAHALVTGANWATTDKPFGLGSSLTLTKSDNSTVPITATDTNGDGTVSLAEAVTSINGANAGITASAVNTGSGYRLQLTSKTTGAASSFSLSSATMPAGTFSVLRTGQDAEIQVGGATGYTVTSPTNTFDGVMDGTRFTVRKADPATEITVDVTTDNDAITSAVQTFVNAANLALGKIKTYTDSTNSAAPLKGNYSLTSMAGSILEAVSSAVGGNSAAVAGLQLTKDGKLTFDASVFKSKLASDPATVQAIFSGTTLVGADGVANTPDDVVDVDGLGARLAVLAERASDSATGTLTSLALGQDARAKDLQDQIDSWDLRLTQRKATLTAQFNAMETALGTLQNQSTWLTSQIASLPSWNTSSSK